MELNEGCCSAAGLCNHQKKSPDTLCKVCTQSVLLESAKEIIARGCSCDRKCELEGGCGCRLDAEKVIRLVRAQQ